MKIIFLDLIAVILLSASVVSGKDDPCYGNLTTWGSNLNTTIVNDGTLGGGYGVIDPETGGTAPPLQFPQNSSLEYLFQGGIWVGAIVNGDTLVSVADDGWWGTREIFPDSCPDGSLRMQSDIADREIIGVFYDTSITHADIDPIDLRPHIPIGVKITVHSYSWFNAPSNDFAILRFTIENIFDHPINDIWIGMFYDGDIHHVEDMGGGATDDLAGSIDAGDRYAVYIIDNNGDPDSFYNWNYMSPTSVCGLILLNPPEDNLTSCFNWWNSNFNPLGDWGPQWQENYHGPFPGGGIGTPGGDAARYFVMSNGERDYDQIYSAIDYSEGGPYGRMWIPPSLGWGGYIALGSDTRMLLSFGSFDLNPGESRNIDLAVVGGEYMHQLPNNFADNLYGHAYDTTSIGQYYENLNFTDFIANINNAIVRYDGPPSIQRMWSTLLLHNQAWDAGTEFTIDAEVAALDLNPNIDSVTLYYRTTGSGSFTSANMTPFIPPHAYRALIPGSFSQPPGVDYFITAVDGDKVGIDPFTAPAYPYQLAILPNVAPRIVHDTIRALYIGEPIPVMAEIIDSTNNVSSASLSYRIAGQPEYQTVMMPNDSSDIYSGIIPAEYVTPLGVNYFIYARDDFNVGNSVGTPDHPLSIEQGWINHPPETFLSAQFRRLYYSCPYLTQFNPGIEARWYCEDPDDPYNLRPTYYHWELFGPFETAADTNSSEQFIYSAFDSTLNEMVRWESFDSASGTEWVTDKTLDIYNLRTGYYYFRVQARDDSMAIDSTYADSLGNLQSAGVFKAMQPYWSSGDDGLKDILVIDDSRYLNFPAECDSAAKARNYQMRILEAAGIDTLNMVTWLNNSDRTLFSGDGGSEVEELMKYRLVLVINDDWYLPLSDSAVQWYHRMLDVGGKIMFTGRYTFLVGNRSVDSTFQIVNGVGDGNNFLGRFARDYLNLHSGTYPGWNFQTNLNQEMVGAYGVEPDFNDLTFDTLRVIEIAYRGSGRWWYEINREYLPTVEYLVPKEGSTTFFTFKSYQPDSSEFERQPVAVGYAPVIDIGGEPRYAFQSSYFTFPFYYVPFDQAVEVMRKMLLWYGFILSDVDDENSALPSHYDLYQNYPNPFNSATTIKYDLPSASKVRIIVYNLLGQRVMELVDEFQPAGYKSIRWDASRFASGIYFFKFTAGDKTFIKRMVMVK